MRVLQVAHYYGTPGGIERVVSQFCSCLRNRYEVEVLVCNTASESTRTMEEGVSVTRVGRIAHLNRMSICPTFPRWLRKMNPDILHIHLINPLAELSFLLAGIQCKTIATYHMDITRQKWLKPLHNPILNRVLDRVELITVSSQRFAETSPVLSNYLEKVRVIPFGVSEDRFRETPLNRALTKDLQERYPGKVVLFVGRLTHYKGLLVLVEAMKKVDATCLIIGSGYLEATIRQAIEKQGMTDKIHLLGNASDEDLVAYYDRADVFVLPSLNRTESFGITQLEAMSRGTPVVCTEIGTGTTTINKDGETGLVVPPGQPAALAEAINRILCDSSLAHKLSSGAVLRCRTKFSEAAMCEKLREVYSELLHR